MLPGTKAPFPQLKWGALYTACAILLYGGGFWPQNWEFIYLLQYSYLRALLQPVSMSPHLQSGDPCIQLLHHP
jgi:hypothetical protein